MTDLDGISGCPELEYLALTNNDIVDISGLFGVNTLQHLDLAHNDALEDITVLATLPNLSYVNIGWGGVTDLQPLLDNPRFGEGDTLQASCTSTPVAQVNELQEKGVLVSWGCK
jgi:hypothetical protein